MAQFAFNREKVLYSYKVPKRWEGNTMQTKQFRALSISKGSLKQMKPISVSHTKGNGTLTINPESVEAKQVREDSPRNKYLY